MPAAIKGIPWDLIKDAICSLGLTYDQVAQKYGIKAATIRKRAQRYSWPIPSAVTNRLQTIVAQRSNAVSQKVSQNTLLTQQKADLWLERQQEARETAFSVGMHALRKAKDVPIEAKSWKDLNYANDIVRKAAGLDKQDGERPVNPWGFVVGVFQQMGGSIGPEKTANAVEVIPEGQDSGQ